MERIREQERIRAEVAEERKRKAEEKKRKAADQGEGAPELKAQKRDEEEAEEQYAPEGEDEEAWMKAVAAEFAEADKKAAADAEDAEAAQKKAEEEAAKKVFAAKAEVKVSLEEGRALFKVSSPTPIKLTSRHYLRRRKSRHSLLGMFRYRSSLTTRVTSCFRLRRRGERRMKTTVAMLAELGDSTSRSLRWRRRPILSGNTARCSESK